MYAQCVIVLFSALLLVLVFGAFIQERSPWRHCPACRLFWHVNRTGQTTKRMPAECDGIAKTQACPDCEAGRNAAMSDGAGGKLES